MPPLPAPKFSDAQQGLFSPAEIQHLMRIEFDRATRYDYPIALMLCEVDRLDSLHDLYGYESREEILHAVFTLLRSMTRESDFLGTFLGDRILALFPHTPGKAAQTLAGRFLRGSRKLKFESDGRSIRATLSIGIGFFEPGKPVAFDQWVDSAEEALAYAIEAGGDRFVQRETAASLIQSLREDLEAESDRLALGLPAEAMEPLAALPRIEDLPEVDLATRIGTLFDAVRASAPTLDLGRLQEDVLNAARECIVVARDRALTELVIEHENQITNLESRVNKLKELLDATETELRQIAERKGLDPGVASIYRSVQGLEEGEKDFERKKEMLVLLFEANMDLRSQIDLEPDGDEKDADRKEP